MPPVIAAILSIISSTIGPLSDYQMDKIRQAMAADENLTKLLQAQAQINANEANNPNLFVSGWRPFIGWGLGTIVIFYAFLTLLINFSIALNYHVIPFPPLDPMVRDIVMGMLGLNISARTFEKWKGVHR
jgi:hypothetical protein